MSQKELELAKVFELVLQKAITQTEGAARLNIDPRWVRIKLKRYKESGTAGLVHKGRDKPSTRQQRRKPCVARRAEHGSPGLSSFILSLSKDRPLLREVFNAIQVNQLATIFQQKSHFFDLPPPPSRQLK